MHEIDFLKSVTGITLTKRIAVSGVSSYKEKKKENKEKRRKRKEEKKMAISEDSRICYTTRGMFF